MNASAYERLKKRIEEQKAIVAESKGAMKQIMETLKNDYGVKTIEEAEDLAEAKEKELTALNDKIETHYVELVELMG